MVYEISRQMLFVTFALATLTDLSWAGARRALVIGNASYPLAPLNTPGKDADDVAKKLDRMGFLVTKRRDLDRRDLAATVREFAQTVNNDDISLVYYTGHGMQLRGENYLIPIDFSASGPSDAEDDAYRETRLLAAIDERSPLVNIFVLDACRDNPYVSTTKSLQKGLAPHEASGNVSMTLIAYATSPGKTAADGPSGSNGVYAQAFLKLVDSPNVDVDRLFRLIGEEVAKRTNNKQVPWRTSSILGDVFLVGDGKTVPAANLTSLRTECDGTGPTAVAACMNAGRAYEEGSIVQKSLSTADQYYSKACRLGQVGGCVKRATLVGCSDGTREALVDIELFPNIAACGARWAMNLLRASKTDSAIACGNDRICASPADACATGWHVCGARGNASDLTTNLTTDQCRGLSVGEFVSALSDQNCSACSSGGGFGAVCCGRGCIQQHGSCVWPNETAWFGQVDGHIQACGDIEMKWDVLRYGVMCCRD